MEKILVLGSNGFLGKHLIKILLDNGFAVYGIDISNNDNVDGLTFFQGDLLDSLFIEKCINTVQPTLLYFLISDFKSKGNTLPIIDNLYYAIKKYKTIKLVHAGSSAQYGRIPINKQPVDENAPFYPVSEYGKTKVLEEEKIIKLSKQIRIDYNIARIFNVTGPYEPMNLVGGALLNRIRNSSNSITLKNGEFERDFLDVRDVASALMSIGLKGMNGESYNVCSGEAISIYDYCKKIIEILKLPQNFDILQEKEINKDVVKILIGDNNKLENKLGWKQYYSIDESIRDLVYPM